MRIIIDLTVTQIKPFSGVGQYAKNLTRQIVMDEEHSFILIMFEGEEFIGEEYLRRKNVTPYLIKRNPSVLENFTPYFAILQSHMPNLIRMYPNSIFFSPFILNGFPIDGFKTFVTIHDFAMPIFNHFSDRGKLVNWYRKKQYWQFMDRTLRADHIITISQSTKDDYLSHYPGVSSEKVSITMLGVELDEKEQNVDDYLPEDWRDKGYFIYLGGGIQRNKNSEGVIRAYSEFISRSNNVESAPYLVIAGKIFDKINCPEMARLRKLIRDLGLKDNIYFSGFFTDSAKYSLLKNSIGFIHLSLYEGFGIAVAEAMRAKVPVIAHFGTSYPEVVGEGGFLVDGTDPVECAEAMFTVYSDKSKATEIAEKGYQQSLKYQWDKTAAETIAIFKAHS